MLARLTLIAQAIAAWLLAAIAGFLVVRAYASPVFGLASLFLVGLGICFLAFMSEVEREATKDHSAKELENRRALGYERPPLRQTLRFLNLLGLGFMAVGVGGGLYYLL